ncbi:MAG: hypothetical protein Q4A72_03115 [Bacillota bacterium]|nr:hypothetical protein [Bacillota bacterium]
MRRIKNYLIIALILLAGLSVYFVFHVPDSPEARVKTLSSEISKYESVEAEEVFKEFMEKYSDAEKLEIFENLPFSMLKDNRRWLVGAMNETLPTWIGSESFNAKYLLTELKLEEKRDMRLIKNLGVVKKEVQISSLEQLSDEVYRIAKENWDIKVGDLYVVDDSLSATLGIQNGAFAIEKLNGKLFEIQDAYTFDVSYVKSTLSVKPSLQKFEDNGAFELAEKMSFFELERFRDHFAKKGEFDAKNCLFELSDRSLAAETDAGLQKNPDHFKIIYNRMELKELEDPAKFTYIGTVKMAYYDEKGETLLKEFVLDLFKDL